ncbi:hypothetical protein PR202_ga07238 [Eleusine coracana subsp. coracana]|uniref:Dipeptidylpeptidase IV N-terminal domain-containing protein n=1 Tax=Eleusine coracana subsp. coracana TaxID=191504 RepID=A0AAV5BX24_ELECO|nr:hypothetical protein PR202_ga07238 [Eleusine coracana subsp. coracana]
MRSVDAAGVERSDQQSSKKPRLGTRMPLADAVVAGAAEGVDCGSMAVEEIVQHPLPGYEAPMSLSFSPDDRRVAFLYSPDGTLNRKVFTIDPAQQRQELLFGPPEGGGLEEFNLSAEERLRRERARERGLGVTRYEWRSPSSGGLSNRAGIVVPLPSGVRISSESLNFEATIPQLTHGHPMMVASDACSGDLVLPRFGVPPHPQAPSQPQSKRNGRNSGILIAGLPRNEAEKVYFQDLAGSEPVLKLQSSPTSPIIDPHLSPNGSMIAYVRDDELHVLGFSDGETRQLTYGARESGKIHGLAEYIAQEEMDRKMGFWWSPDSRHIAFTEVDSSEIPLYRIMHQGKDYVGPDAQEDHAYPFAGAANVKVRLGVVRSNGGEVTWMDLLCGEPNGAHSDEEYLARVNWMTNNTLAVQVLNRTQTKLKLLKFDIATGKRKVLLEEI